MIPIDDFAISAMCRGKESFSSPQVAMRVPKKRARKQRRATEAKINHVYRCDVCRQFHLGKPMRRQEITHRKRIQFLIMVAEGVID